MTEPQTMVTCDKVAIIQFMPKLGKLENPWVYHQAPITRTRIQVPHRALVEVPYEFVAFDKRFKGTYFLYSNDERYDEKKLRSLIRKCHLDSVYGKGGIYLHHDSYEKYLGRDFMGKVRLETHHYVDVINFPEFDEFSKENQEARGDFVICY
jgi:hypothetical protein